MPSRRAFLVGAAGMAAAGAFARITRATGAGTIRVGYAAITWGGKDLEAIDDIASVGFRGIQLRSPILEQFGAKPGALKDLLASRKLTFVALSSGAMRIDPAFEAEDLATHTKHARFLRDTGGLYLQLTDSRPKRDLVAADYRRLGRLLSELGKRTADIGVPVAYHNHMNGIGERPDEVDAVLDAADPEYVKLLLDIAHYQQGGGDPVKAVRQYGSRILLLHLKDLESPAPGETGDLSRSYRFLELGRGKVDVKGVVSAMTASDFTGWAIIELDGVTDPSRSPKDSAVISRDYVTKTLGLTI